MRRVLFAIPIAALVALAGAARLGGAAAPPACDPDNGGLKLPEGFCALVIADDVGTARHLAIAPNGDVYVALQEGRAKPLGVIALRDTNGDGKMDQTERFGDKSTTGIELHNGYLYVATISSVERFEMTPGQLKPTGAAEVVVADLPVTRPHQDKGIAFDGKGSLYVNVGAPSNACQPQDRRPKLAGQDPCPMLETSGGIWKFDENKLGQKQIDGVRYATGLRQMPGIAWHDGALYTVMNNRDQLDSLWGEAFTPEDNQTRPAEPMYRIQQGDNFGWPFCFYDYTLNKLLLNPEYGGDGKTVGRCSEFKLPIATFPAHWAPVDLMFYSGTMFPAKYRDGAFIAFHGSWNRAPTPQRGYNVVFQPFAQGRPAGDFEVFASGFVGKDPLLNPTEALARPDGLAQAPDGSLYVTDSQKGKVWRILYTGR